MLLLFIPCLTIIREMYEYTEVPEYPCIVASHHDWVVVYKPRGMHSSAHGSETEHVLMTWAVSTMPELSRVTGYWEHDYGLLHRLDRETAGLLLIAKTQEFFDYLANSKTVLLKKLYSLHAEINPFGLKGSIPLLYVPKGLSNEQWLEMLTMQDMSSVQNLLPHEIASLFRAYGKGRALVACRVPHSIDKYNHSWSKTWYTTHILACELRDRYFLMNIMLERGFRHQIRAHCAWMGLPLVGDQLYNTQAQPGDTLSLVACGLEFTDFTGNRHRIML